MPKTMQSQLARHQAQSPLSNDELYQLKRKAWLDKEGLYLSTEQIKQLAITHQWAIEIIGNITYP